MKSTKLCECGCGGFTNLARQTNTEKGWIRGEPLRFVHGHNRKITEFPSERHCPECQEEWPANETFFYPDKAHPSGLSTYCRECQKIRTAQWVKENPERHAETCRNNQINMPTELRRIYNTRWRAKSYEAEGDFTIEPLQVFSLYKGKCGDCGCFLDPDDWDLDHIERLSEGGKHTLDNLQPLCPSCHGRKSANERWGRVSIGEGGQ